MLTVIIPTFRRALSLKRTLESMQKQSLKEFEVIVVDNAGEDSVENMVNQMDGTSHINIRYIRHTQGGNSGARNRGALEANSEVLVFTDDDLTFEPMWLSAYQRAFSEYPEMVAAGGCVRPKWQASPPQWLIRYIDNRKIFPIYALMDLGKEFKMGVDGIFFSCNMAIRKSVFQWTGLRPEIYGTQTIGSGESGLNKELSRSGYAIGYVPEAITYHHISYDRMTVKYIRRWAWHQGGAEMYQNWAGRRRNLSMLGIESVSICRRHWRYFFKYILVFGKNDPDSIDIQFRASLGWCKLNYLWWMIKDRKVQEALDLKEFCP